MNKTPHSDEFLYDLSDFFKLFGDSTRLKIIFSLMDTELCVNDISNELGMSQSSISHQLKILRQNKIVKNRKIGKQVFYSLDDEHVSSIIIQGVEHLEHNKCWGGKNHSDIYLRKNTEH